MPSSFITPLRLEFRDDTTFQLTEPFEFLSEVTQTIIDVPAGFVTDFASVPRVLWNILPPTGRYGKAAVVHDWLYQTRDAGFLLVNRKMADDVLHEGMVALNVGRLTRWAIYAGIRLGGGLVWSRYRAADRG